ncbi:MAG: HAMP domain-containing histidine kinase [Lachnospiraceae bacterium]|nr:HAMP domain-containing histidine kinase [Lachnospiraceae bacterium]
MDWIEEQIEKFQKKVKNTSLQKAMVLYLVFAIFITLAAVGITNEICDNFMNVILEMNNMSDEYQYIGDCEFVIQYGEDDNIIGMLKEIVTISESDNRLWQALSLIKSLCIPVYSAIAVILVSAFYYRNKLQEPVHLLKKEMEAIKRNDLSFSCYYDNTDEMGDICKTMDSMRKAVLDNQKNMWELMEEQRKINGAFAHDIRTPLTVIIGYTQMLSEYCKSGQVDDAMLKETLGIIEKQAVRMQVFSETMKEINGFEMLEVFKKSHTISELHHEISSFAEGLKAENAPYISVTVKGMDEILYYDENIIMEVLSNLLSNALRYGKERVEVLAEHENGFLYLYVKDDGKGMTREELYKADRPYYSGENMKQDLTSEVGQTGRSKQDGHMGLGLTICKLLCKKHGGFISFSNSIEGGAVVCAQFNVG